MGFEAVVEFDDEGVGEHGADGLLVLDDVLLLVLADELLQHDLHGVELAVAQTLDQVHLAETPDGQALADFVLFQSALAHVLQTVEPRLPLQHSLPDRDLVVQKYIMVGRLEPDHLRRFEQRIGVAHA